MMSTSDIVRIVELNLIGEVVYVNEDGTYSIKITGKDSIVTVCKSEIEKIEVKEPKRLDDVEVNVLGVTYTIKFLDEDDYRWDNTDGITDKTTKEIFIKDFKFYQGDVKDLVFYQNVVIRHELIHAFLYESGLDSSCGIWGKAWAENEEMVDWIAIQLPKIVEAYKEAGVL